LLDYDALKWAHVVSQFQFVDMELDLAITFAETAASSGSKERTERNIENAMLAYRTATKFIQRDKFSPQMMAMLAEKVERLSLLVGQL